MGEQAGDTYSGQSLDELMALRNPPGEVYLPALLYQAVDQKVHRQNRDYTEFEVTVPTVIEFEAQVKNGGFYQFLTNYSSRFAGSLLEALQRIGACKSATIAKAALKALPSNWQSLERAAVENLLDPYDQELFKVFRAEEDLSEALVDFVAQNRDEFSLPV